MPRLPRFQFSLRTMLIVITLLCLWMGWQVHDVRQRAEMLIWLRQNNWVAFLEDEKLLWHREILDDHYLGTIMRPFDVPPEKVNRVQSTFPEADVSPWPVKRK